jgi:hypothetical protein
MFIENKQEKDAAVILQMLQEKVVKLKLVRWGKLSDDKNHQHNQMFSKHHAYLQSNY